jgi:sterol desaturase/sphingolipid hydroxylase (fatty acid hydroxylase superfamily)
VRFRQFCEFYSVGQTLVTALLAVLVVERFWPIRKQSWWRKDTLGDFAWFLTIPLCVVAINMTVARAATSAVQLVLTGRADGTFRLHWADSLPGWMQIVIAILGAELNGYAYHRLQHTRYFWRFHAIHHSATQMDYWVGFRRHPLDMVAPRLVGPFFAISGIPEAFWLPWFFLDMLQNTFSHMNVRWTFGPLRHIFISPVAHHWHHSADPAVYDKNFGQLLTLFDKLFGTFYLPDGKVPDKYGDPELSQGYFKQLAYPFRRQRKTEVLPAPAGL